MALNSNHCALDLLWGNELGLQGLPCGIEGRRCWVEESCAHHFFLGAHEVARRVLQPCIVAPKLIFHWELIEVKG